MKAVILAGGLGTRLREETEFRPKPMVEVGNRPILWHIMKNLSSFGIRDFVIATGYKSDLIKEYFLNYEAWNNDFTIQLGRRDSLTFHDEHTEADWRVTVADTGQETMTGGRIFRVAKYLQDERFVLTYGDGLCDVDMNRLIDFHIQSGRLATVTTVQPTSRFGLMAIAEDGQVRAFAEKPQMDGWVSAGFFVMEPQVLSYLDEDCVFENEPLARLAADGQLSAFRHYGFWQPMDTYREARLLNEMWNSGQPPWQMW